MIYVYCQRGSDSARALATALQPEGGVRVRKFDGEFFWRKGKRIKLVEGDVVVSWGEEFPEVPGIRILNGKAVPSKYQVALDLSNAGIPTITVAPGKYGDPAAVATKWKGMEWLPRKNSHVGGDDLLVKTVNPDYWSAKLDLSAEYRIHSFKNKSIRAGEKRLREGYSLNQEEVDASGGQLLLAHPWIRSYDGGWKVAYDNFQSRESMRVIAHKAVEALGLDFGAVDIGMILTKDLETGKPVKKFIVLEVNRAPGIEGNSITIYAKAIKEWINEVGGVQAGGAVAGERLEPAGDQDTPVINIYVEPPAVDPGLAGIAGERAFRTYAESVLREAERAAANRQLRVQGQNGEAGFARFTLGVDPNNPIRPLAVRAQNGGGIFFVDNDGRPYPAGEGNNNPPPVVQPQQPEPVAAAQPEVRPEVQRAEAPVAAQPQPANPVEGEAGIAERPAARQALAYNFRRFDGPNDLLQPPNPVPNVGAGRPVGGNVPANGEAERRGVLPRPEVARAAGIVNPVEKPIYNYLWGQRRVVVPDQPAPPAPRLNLLTLKGRARREEIRRRKLARKALKRPVRAGFRQGPLNPNNG